MTEREKTREQLLEEVQALRQRLARLEGQDGAPGPADSPPDDLRDFLTLLLLHAPVPIYATSADGRCLLVNRAWEDVFGRRLEEVFGRGDGAPGPPAHAFRESDGRVPEAAAPVTLE